MAQILVIDDDKSVRKMVTDCLKCEHDVVTACGGLEAIAEAHVFYPDLVVCDVNMPIMDGFEVFDRFRSNEQLMDVVFIFLSGSGDRHTIRQGMTMGADDFLLKPFSVNELRQVIRQRLEKRERQRALMTKEIDELRLNITTALPHELRTSIMIMEGYAQLILDDPTNQDGMQREMVESILSNATRLRHMAEKYLWYLRSYLPEKINASTWTDIPSGHIQRCVSVVAERFDRIADLNLYLGDAPVAIDPEYLIKVVEEVAENAFKFSKSGTPVTITANPVENTYRITVSNLGWQITPEQIQRIGAFMQFDRQQYEQQGTGLGLIIVKRLVELHGGNLEIESVAGKTEISITLSCHTAEAIAI